jgi:hypothetical protein
MARAEWVSTHYHKPVLGLRLSLTLLMLNIWTSSHGDILLLHPIHRHMQHMIGLKKLGAKVNGGLSPAGRLGKLRSRRPRPDHQASPSNPPANSRLSISTSPNLRSSWSRAGRRPIPGFLPPLPSPWVSRKSSTLCSCARRLQRQRVTSITKMAHPPPRQTSPPSPHLQ